MRFRFSMAHKHWSCRLLLCKMWIPFDNFSWMSPWIFSIGRSVCLSQNPWNLLGLFRLHNLMRILKTKTFRGMKFCNKCALWYLEITVKEAFYSFATSNFSGRKSFLVFGETSPRSWWKLVKLRDYNYHSPVNVAKKKERKGGADHRSLDRTYLKSVVRGRKRVQSKVRYCFAWCVDLPFRSYWPTTITGQHIVTKGG